MKSNKNTCVSVQQITLEQLFKNNYFSIPEYQRGYSWEKEQRLALWGDILSVAKINEEKYKHYMGTIVAINKVGENCYDIIDGQQRLTSLILLLHTIATNDTVHEKITENLKELYFQRNDKQVFKSGLQSVILESIFFENKTNFDKSSLIKQDQNIIDAIDEFSGYLNDYLDCNNHTVEKLLKIIEEKLGFIFFVPVVKSVAGRMFEVINNRGKELSELDKLKNYFVFVAESEDHQIFKDAINRNWRKILENIQKAGFVSTDEENEFLRYCWIVFGSSNKRKSYHVYKSVKEKVAAMNDGHSEYLNEFLLFLSKSSENIKKIFTAKPMIGQENENNLFYEKIALQLNITKAGVMPLIIAVMYHDDNINNKKILLDLIEKLNFRYYVAEIANRNDTDQGELYRWANWYYKKKDDKDNDFNSDKLITNLKQFINKNTKDIHLIERLVLQKDDNRNFYKWKGLLYLLARYELSLKDSEKETFSLGDIMPKRNNNKSNDHSEREHIWSIGMEVKLPKKSLAYLKELNQKRLGNFTLLKRDENASASNESIQNKMVIYNDSNRIMTSNIVSIYEKLMKDDSGILKNNSQGKEFLKYTFLLDRLEEYLVNFTLKEWSIDIDSYSAVKIESFDYQEVKPISENTYKIIKVK